MTTPHQNDQQSHPVPGINADINGNPLTAPTDKDSLGVATLWKDLKLGDISQEGDRKMFFGTWVACKGGRKIDSSSPIFQRPEPTNWQARAIIAEQLEAEANRLLSASKAEARRLKWLIGQFLGDLPEKRDWLNPDIEREMKAISPAEKGGLAWVNLPEKGGAE